MVGAGRVHIAYSGKRTLRSEELAGDVEGLASHNNDLLALKELLGDGAGQATEKVALRVNDDLREELASIVHYPIQRPCRSSKCIVGSIRAAAKGTAVYGDVPPARRRTS